MKRLLILAIVNVLLFSANAMAMPTGYKPTGLAQISIDVPSYEVPRIENKTLPALPPASELSDGLDTSQRISDWGYETISNSNYKFVGRYLEISPDVGAPTWGGKIYYLTENEMGFAWENNVDIFLIFEWCLGRSRLPSGYSNGFEDATIAVNSLKKLGLPETTVVYYSLDAAPGRVSQYNINEYFRGINDVVSSWSVGCYGSKAMLTELRELGYIKYLWYATWIDGNNVSPYGWGATMYQRTWIIKVGGVYCDQNWNFRTYFGQVLRQY